MKENQQIKINYDKIKARQYYLDNKEKIKEQRKVYYRNNKTKIDEYHSNYIKKKKNNSKFNNPPFNKDDPNILTIVF